MILAAVGLGLGADQLTVGGLGVLRASPWIGFHGLPDVQVELLVRRAPHAVLVDLDGALSSALHPNGFTHRAASLAVAAALHHGRAALAVAGHPCFANPLTGVAASLTWQAGGRFEVVAAPTTIDAWAAETQSMLGPPGLTAVDARSLCERPFLLDPRLTLVVWNASYLDTVGLTRLAAVLSAVWGPDAWLSPYRAGAPLRSIPVGRPDLWSPLLTYETTLVVPVLPS